MRVVAVLVLLLGLAPPPAVAQSLDLADPVPGHPGATAFALMQQIIPDLLADGTGTVPAVPHILGDDWREEPPATLELGGIELVPFEAKGAPHVAMLAALGQSDMRVGPTTILATFDAQLRLLDVVDVGTDQFTSFRAQPTLRVGPGDDVLAVANAHFNSNQDYDAVQLIRLSGGRLALIGEIQLFGDRTCGYVQSQSLDLAATGGPEGHWPIVATVTDELVLSGETCGDDELPEPFEKTVTVTYRWDAALGRYVADSDAFERLAEANSARF